MRSVFLFIYMVLRTPEDGCPYEYRFIPALVSGRATLEGYSQCIPKSHHNPVDCESHGRNTAPAIYFRRISDCKTAWVCQQTARSQRSSWGHPSPDVHPFYRWQGEDGYDPAWSHIGLQIHVRKMHPSAGWIYPQFLHAIAIRWPVLAIQLYLYKFCITLYNC